MQYLMMMVIMTSGIGTPQMGDNGAKYLRLLLNNFNSNLSSVGLGVSSLSS
jgi:hypothetical protein